MQFVPQLHQFRELAPVLGSWTPCGILFALLPDQSLVLHGIGLELEPLAEALALDRLHIHEPAAIGKLGDAH
ncbi:hypothetical protein D3C76_1754650 [compost metagenome]